MIKFGNSCAPYAVSSAEMQSSATWHAFLGNSPGTLWHMHAGHESLRIMYYAICSVQHCVLYFLYWSCVRTNLDIACPIFNLVARWHNPGLRDSWQPEQSAALIGRCCAINDDSCASSSYTTSVVKVTVQVEWIVCSMLSRAGFLGAQACACDRGYSRTY